MMVRFFLKNKYIHPQTGAEIIDFSSVDQECPDLEKFLKNDYIGYSQVIGCQVLKGDDKK
jgi:hypothetical protein